MEEEKLQDEEVKAQAVPVNRKAKDTFFKTVYSTEKRQRELASYLLGIRAEETKTSNVRPVLFGNRENDLAFLCDRIFYMMTESQSTVSPNVPYRMLEYMTAGLRATVDSERLLYGKKRVYFPIPKMYMLQTGLEENQTKLPGKVQYDIQLSDSYMKAEGKYDYERTGPDLETVVHVYDFRMMPEEICAYIEEENLPERFSGYENDMRNYALTANGITYIQRAGKKRSQEGYKMPKNVADVADYLTLLRERGIFVDLFSDKEVCDMAMAQFSRDDMLIYQGREEGIVKGIVKGEVLHMIKAIYKKMQKGKTNEEIAEELEEETAQVERIKEAILKDRKKYANKEFDAERVLDLLEDRNID